LIVLPYTRRDSTARRYPT